MAINPNRIAIRADEQISVFCIYLHLLFFNRLWFRAKNYKMPAHRQALIISGNFFWQHSLQGQSTHKMHSYILTTERLTLRRWLDSDTQPFIEMNKDVEVMKYFPKTLTDVETFEMIERINLHFAENNFGLFAVENTLTKQFIGFTGFAIPSFETFFTPCIEIGWRYKRDAWGQGFATEAANACLKYGFDHLNFDKVVSFTSTINKNSEKVMQRIGMTYLTNFDHPKIEKGNILCPHFLYQITKK